ncbi:maker403 [Drosophila busckii]|uniref:CG15422 n=1 Tax=Drosophila busckii TaxID=30019 RepID=A0A0M4EDV7_DROBS|nr:uncharacterized protein LOC108604093 [Drosophila busckii]ALC38076.1 CG15422 [Drosophila busckii]ALC38155.1 maker403 [Drosophila busckii]
MRYYEDPYRCHARHHHFRPNIEVDVFPGWGGSYYSPAFARPEVVVVSPATNYVQTSQVIVQPQPYPAPAAYYQQQTTYQYQQQYQQYNNPPYPRW